MELLKYKVWQEGMQYKKIFRIKKRIENNTPPLKFKLHLEVILFVKNT